MTKAAIAYHSKTGHSRKIAEAIGNTLGLPVTKITDKQETADLLFLVGGIYGGRSDPAMLDAVAQLESADIKQVVLLTSSADAKTKQGMVRDILERKGIAVDEEEFNCRGSFLFFGMKHPDKNDIENAVAFVKKKLDQFDK